MEKPLPRQLAPIVAVCALWAAAGCQAGSQKVAAPQIDPNHYYAVLLSNGSVYFGKLQGLGTPYPTLRDVFYIQSTTDPDKKTVSNVLIKRGKELHAPDLMILNEKSILFVEPVGTQSKVAQLIQESKSNQ